MSRSVRKVILTGIDGKVRNGPCRLIGFAVRESGGTASATMLVYDGLTAAGAVIPVSLAAGESAREWWGEMGDGIEPGVLMEEGIYIDFGGTGTVQGVLFMVDA